MKTVDIEINRYDILEKVVQATAYSGARTPPQGEDDAADRFFRVTAADADGKLLRRYWDEAAAALVERIKQFVRTASFAGSSLSLTLDLSGAYDDSLTPAVSSAISSYMVSAMLARWYRITLPALAGGVEDDSLRLLREVERQLCHRRAPRRRRASSITTRNELT